MRWEEFYNSVAGFNNLNGGGTDWNGSKTWVKNSVNSAYKEQNSTMVKERGWPRKMVWKPKVPYKVNCFIWLLAKEAVLTQENLSKMGHQLASRCFLCQEQIETINHLFLHCSQAVSFFSVGHGSSLEHFKCSLFSLPVLLLLYHYLF